jgi:haloalkane dehalogenase
MRQAVLDGVGVQAATLVGQDWGGLIGLRLVAENPDRFARIVVANTGLPTGDHPMSDAFLSWQKFSQETPDFPVGRIVSGGCKTDLPAEVIAAYDAPFPDDSYKAGARAFPMLVPTSHQDPASVMNRRAWDVLEGWDRPLLTAFSDGDPITGGGDKVFQRLVPGAAGRRHVTLEGGGHFLQEDVGPRLAAVLAQFVATT